MLKWVTVEVAAVENAPTWIWAQPRPTVTAALILQVVAAEAARLRPSAQSEALEAKRVQDEVVAALAPSGPPKTSSTHCQTTLW